MRACKAENTQSGFKSGRQKAFIRFFSSGKTQALQGKRFPQGRFWLPCAFALTKRKGALKRSLKAPLRFARAVGLWSLQRRLRGKSFARSFHKGKCIAQYNLSCKKIPPAVKRRGRIFVKASHYDLPDFSLRAR